MMLKFTPSPQLVINVTNCIIEVGMELFFVLSGFVIHYNYADVGRRPHLQNLARFYIARFARIYPLSFLSHSSMSCMAAICAPRHFFSE